MARTILAAFAAVLAIAAGIFQFSVKPKLVTLGYGRVIEPVGNDKCRTFPELQACEKLVIHQPSGVVYLACSTPASRTHWIPAMGRLNATGKSSEDYIATFDPATAKITRLATAGFDSPRGLSVHGMDVVPADGDPATLFVYVVNHRTPEAPAAAAAVGADSAVEVFRTTVGGTVLTHLRTVEDPVIATPNDVVGSGDGMSFYFTNDHGTVKTGIARALHLDILLKRPWSDVGYCHLDHDCKVAVKDLQGANGIAKGLDNQFYVASALFGQIYILEQQDDKSLVVTDMVHLDRPVDNLSVDTEHTLWGAGIPRALHLGLVHFETPSIHSPSSAIRISLNTGQSRYFGEKYKIEKPFEDDGLITSGATSVAYDAVRRRLFLHGLCAPQLSMCEL